MSNISKKFASIALMATTAVWASGALVLVAPVAANAQSTADLQAQIAQLLAQIQQLQSQLNTAKGTAASSSSYNFTRDLTVGSKGADVSALQQVLINGGYLKVSAPTGYFGSLTKAAVAAWQKASGVSPALGYFGPKSRAALAASAPASGTTTTTTTSGSGTTVTTTTNAPASGLAVALSASNPAAGALISSSGSAAARVPVVTVAVTAGNSSPVTVTEIKFHKTGVLSDSSISGAYIVENGQVLAQYTSLSNGVIDFPGMSLSVGAGQTRNLTLAIDPAQGLSAGNTVSFALASANDINSVDSSGNAITETGPFPLQGNTFTVTSVSNPSIASITVASSSIGTTVNAGTQAVIVGAWSITGSNSKVWLKGVKFTNVGSANPADVRNLKLIVNGTQYGQTLPSISSAGYAYFDLSANPATLNTGANNVQIQGDVMGSPNKNFQFEILNAYDILAVDSQYNVPVQAASNVGTQISINNGQITVTADTNTPTGNIAKGQSNVALAKYDVYAAGEAVKIKFLSFTLTFTGTTTTISTTIKNVHLDDDVGGSVGTTINTPPSSNTCTDGGTAGYNTAGTVYTDCFGTSGSPINYVVPANTTRVLTLKGDVQSGAAFTTVTGALVASTNSNLQGLISSQTANSGAATGSALSLASNSLTVAQNTAFGAPTISKGSTNAQVGSYALTASSAEGVNVSNLTVTMASASSTDFQNLRVVVNGKQFGTTQPTLANSGAYSFSGTQFTVPAGQSTIVSVYADVLSSATAQTDNTLTTLSGCSASGAVSYVAVTCTSTGGQNVIVASGPALTLSPDVSQAPAGQLVMGSTQQELARFRFTETSNVENVKVTDLNVIDSLLNSTNKTTSTTKTSFGNLSLYTTSGTLLGTAGSAASNTATSSYKYGFHFASPIIVPQGNSVTVVLKGDVSSYSSSGASDNSIHTFEIATSTESSNTTTSSIVTALGASSNQTAGLTFSGPSTTSTQGNQMTVLRTQLAVSTSPLGATTGRTKGTNDDLGTITFAANSAGAAQLNSLTITFGGTAPSIGTFLGTVDLIDANGNSVMSTTGVASSTTGTCTGANTCSKTWNFGTTGTGWQVSSGGSYSFKLRLLNSASATWAAGQGVSATISATVNAKTDVGFTDGLDTNATGGLNLPANAVPINIQSASYAAGT